MNKSLLSPAEKFWIGLGVYVLGADTYLWRNKHDTMSIQFGDWLTTRNGRAVCIGVTGGMIIHLFFGIPLPFQRQAKKYLGGKPLMVIRPLENKRNKKKGASTNGVHADR